MSGPDSSDLVFPAAPTGPRPRPVFARHAASLLVLRQGAAGPEVLMGVRGKGHRFMPNRLVFPGGAVDPADRTAPARTEPRPDLLAMLAPTARAPLARGIVHCAARELEEETGMTLGSPPDLAGMEYLCRAVTPPESPIRFNARFLIVDAEHVQGSPADSLELQEVGFRPVDDLLRMQVMLVTREVLERLALWSALGVEERRGRRELPVFRRKRWSSEPFA